MENANSNGKSEDTNRDKGYQLRVVVEMSAAYHPPELDKEAADGHVSKLYDVIVPQLLRESLKASGVDEPEIKRDLISRGAVYSLSVGEKVAGDAEKCGELEKLLQDAVLKRGENGYDAKVTGCSLIVKNPDGMSVYPPEKKRAAYAASPEPTKGLEWTDVVYGC